MSDLWDPPLFWRIENITCVKDIISEEQLEDEFRSIRSFFKQKGSGDVLRIEWGTREAFEESEKLSAKEVITSIGFGDPQYDIYKEGTPWVCHTCGYIRVTNNLEKPNHKCAICNTENWGYIRKFL